MAEENKIVITTEVKTDGAVNSLKSLKAELKAAQAAALNGDGKAAQRVAELKDRLDDLKDSTKTLQGSGVEKISSSFNLLGEGFRNFDFDKIKTGFKGVGSAMSAVPVFLIVEGIMALIRNFDELSKGNGILAQSLQALGKVFDWLKEGVYAVTDAIGLTNSELDKQGDAIATNSEKVKEALSGQMAQFDRQIAVAKAAGKSTVELEKAKQQAIIDTNVAVARQIEAFVRAGGELDDEKRKLLTASLEAIKNAKVQEYVIEQDANTKKQEQYKSHLAEMKKIKEEHDRWIIEGDKALAEQRLDNEQSANKMFAQMANDGLKEALDVDIINTSSAMQQMDDLRQAEFLRNVERQENLNQINLEQANKQLTTQSNLQRSLQNLSDITFLIKSFKAKKGAEEDEKLAKKQFQINKALQLSGAAIDGAKAITASLAASPLFIGVAPNPAGIASLAAAITTTAASIAKIATTQFQSSASAGGESGMPNLATPNINTTAPTTEAPSNVRPPTTGLDEQGNVIGSKGQRAYVVETDITNNQKRINRYNAETSF